MTSDDDDKAKESEYFTESINVLEVTRVKKTSLGESLAGSHAYNPIRDSRRDPWRDFLARTVLSTVWPRVLPRVSARVSDRIVCMTPGEALSETRFFYAGNYHATTEVKYQILTLLTKSWSVNNMLRKWARRTRRKSSYEWCKTRGYYPRVVRKLVRISNHSCLRYWSDKKKYRSPKTLFLCN